MLQGPPPTATDTFYVERRRVFTGLSTAPVLFEICLDMLDTRTTSVTEKGVKSLLIVARLPTLVELTELTFTSEDLSKGKIQFLNLLFHTG